MKRSKIKDFDPESLLDPAPSSSSDEHSDGDLSDATDDNAGREHYAAVGKSKLRKPIEVPLGPKYEGRGVSRTELEDSDSDDPFERGFNDEDSDDSSDSSEEGSRGITKLQINGDEDSEVEGMSEDFDQDTGDDDEDNEDDLDSEQDSDDDVEADDSNNEGSENDSKDDASALRDMLKDTKAFTSTLAAGAQSDVAKGEAVKTQRKTFDSLLNGRIRLQKALIATNSFTAGPQQATSTAPVEAAEAAALTLLNNLTSLRVSLEEARSGEKRKRTHFDSDMSSAEIWASIQRTEKSTLSHRKAVMERWSNKTKATTVANNKARLNASAQQTLIEVLDSQLNSSHLITRTQTPRSCAPIQSAVKAPQPDPAIYDDADFYGLLLKELLEQRSSDLNASGSAEFVVQAPWQVARENKTKKVVDTKASKGRRLRYTVQEKLQNFMAPEERGQWGDRQREELFSSLFGQRLGLGEHDDIASEEEEMVDAEEAGLMLFRS